MLNLRLLPLLRTDVFRPFNLRNQLVVQADVLYGIASDVNFLNAVEALSVLDEEGGTLSLIVADSNLMLVNLSTPLRIPL